MAPVRNPAAPMKVNVTEMVTASKARVSDGTKELSGQVFDFKTSTADLTHQEMVTAMSRLTVKLAEQLADGTIDQEAR